jgi:hypothetical protein
VLLPRGRYKLNDLGREMEVLLYGHSGGFALRLETHRTMNRAARTLQCMMRMRFYGIRVAQRAAERMESAAIKVPELVTPTLLSPDSARAADKL